jgi:hypothetical protein
MKNIKHYITINNKKYFYTLKSVKKDTTLVECEAANLVQKFLNEDIPDLLNDLPNLIMAEKQYKKQQSELIRFRVTPDDKKLIEKKAVKKGYSSVSGYLRDLALGNV